MKNFIRTTTTKLKYFFSEIKSLAEFLGGKYKEELLKNNENLLNYIVEKASIKNMKKKSTQMVSLYNFNL